MINRINRSLPTFKGFQLQQRQNTNHYKTKPMGFDSVSFSGKPENYSSPIIKNNSITTTNKEELFEDNDKGISLGANGHGSELRTAGKEFKGGLVAYKNIYQDNENALIGMSDNGSYSIESLYGNAYTNAKEYEGKIYANGDVNQTNKNAVIGSVAFDTTPVIASEYGTVKTNAKEIKGSVHAGINIVQDNENAVISADELGDSLKITHSRGGSISTKAKYIEGDIIAKNNVFIIGKGDIEGTISSEEGFIFLIDAKDKSEYNFDNDINIETDIITISKEQYEEEYLPELMTSYQE